MLFHRHHYCGRLQCPTVTDIVDSSVSIRLPCFGLLAAAQRIHQVEGRNMSFSTKKNIFLSTDFVWFVLTAQKELGALLRICFTPIHVFLIFYDKHNFGFF